MPSCPPDPPRVPKDHPASCPGHRPNLDPLYHAVSLQTWTQSAETLKYWAVLDHGFHSPQQHPTGDRPSDTAANHAFLQELQAREAHHWATWQGRELLQQTGAVTYEGTRPWMERTGWMTTYQGVPRTILKRMVMLPSQASTVHGLPLGEYQGHQLASAAADEEYIAYLISAVDQVLDRCEETIEHTGHHIRTWLQSHLQDRPWRRPFGPLATRQGHRRYRQVWKKFIAFTLRVFRLGPGLSQQILKLHLLPQHRQELQQIWDRCILLRAASYSCWSRQTRTTTQAQCMDPVPPTGPEQAGLEPGPDKPRPA
ncbi:hypothetical protein BDV12DRAFT_205332, partial [Aspergillus spectabilis]